MTTTPNFPTTGHVRIDLDDDVVGTPDVGGWVSTAGRRERFDGWLELLALLRAAVRHGEV